MAKGLPGLPTDNASPFASESFVLEHSDAPFGVVVVSDKEGLCRLPDKDNILEKGGSTGVAVGVTMRHQNHDVPCVVPLVAPIGSGDVQYALVGRAVNIITMGSIFVRTETSVTRNQEVFYRITSCDIGNLGAIRGDADNGKAVKLNGAVFKSDAVAGEVVAIALHMSAMVQENY